MKQFTLTATIWVAGFTAGLFAGVKLAQVHAERELAAWQAAEMARNSSKSPAKAPLSLKTQQDSQTGTREAVEPWTQEMPAIIRL